MLGRSVGGKKLKIIMGDKLLRLKKINNSNFTKIIKKKLCLCNKTN